MKLGFQEFREAIIYLCLLVYVLVSDPCS